MLLGIATAAQDQRLDELARDCGLTLNAAQERALTHARLLMAQDEDLGVIGFLLLWLLGDEAEVIDVGVDPRHRRSGVGAALLQRALHMAEQSGARRTFLEVRAGNHAARALYEHAGFEPYGTRARYYSNGEDAVLYTHVTLPPPRLDRGATEP